MGCNIGRNLIALRHFIPNVSAVEPNAEAAQIARAHPELAGVRIDEADGFALPYDDASVDLVFTSGVLIHVAPDDLGRMVDEILRVARHYVLCIEYFAHEPTAVPYHGREGYLFKRDFGRFYLERAAGVAGARLRLSLAAARFQRQQQLVAVRQAMSAASPRVLGLIPAKGASTRLPRKNLRLLGGRPLIDWTIAAAKRRASATASWCRRRMPRSQRSPRGRRRGAVRTARRTCRRSGRCSSGGAACARYARAAGDRYDVICIMLPTSLSHRGRP